MSTMFVWLGKEAEDDVNIIGRVAFVLAELLCIGRVCYSFDSDSFCLVILYYYYMQLFDNN